MSVDESKYKVPVLTPDKPIRVSKEKMEELKGLLKAGMINKMRKDGVDCPVRKEMVSFVECFMCPNFLRRVSGIVDCKGLPLTS